MKLKGMNGVTAGGIKLASGSRVIDPYINRIEDHLLVRGFLTGSTCKCYIPPVRLSYPLFGSNKLLINKLCSQVKRPLDTLRHKH
jgi:hypothetical protein